jgi:sacsin
MIQNADDAGATVVQFYVDCRQHGTSGLVKQELKDYQGPALISANDAVFSERDWEGIQSLQQSIKADDPFKVGRFGIGFNSVYHLTGKVELP